MTTQTEGRRKPAAAKLSKNAINDIVSQVIMSLDHKSITSKKSNGMIAAIQISITIAAFACTLLTFAFYAGATRNELKEAKVNQGVIQQDIKEIKKGQDDLNRIVIEDHTRIAEIQRRLDNKDK